MTRRAVDVLSFYRSIGLPTLPRSMHLKNGAEQKFVTLFLFFPRGSYRAGGRRDHCRLTLHTNGLSRNNSREKKEREKTRNKMRSRTEKESMKIHPPIRYLLPRVKATKDFSELCHRFSPLLPSLVVVVVDNVSFW